MSKYVYLGIEFNNLLNIDEMPKFRIDKGKMVLAILVQTPRNNRIPLEYRTMLIKGILIPTLTYGCEIYGMSEKRTNPLKLILDNSLKVINRRSNFSRLRSYDEFDIKPLYVVTALARIRGLKKWANAKGIISEYIKSQTRFKSIKSTWIKQAKR